MTARSVAIVGGGPAGLYLAIQLRKADPRRAVTVYERNRAEDTFGWGVVFSNQTLDNFRAADPETFGAITAAFARWDDIDIHFRGRTITSGGHGFAGLARRTLLAILQERARGLGAELSFGADIAEDAGLDAGVIVAADGVNSTLRRKYAAQLQPDLDVRKARYVWLGSTRPFDAFTFIIVENGHGVFQAHAYQFAQGTSAFIVECDEASWCAAGFDRMDADATVAACEALFAPWLDGHRLMHNAAHQAANPWTRFVRVSNARWHHGNVVLIGDAAHTAHFSIGSGTKLAMEDAISLARHLDATPDFGAAFAAYQQERRTEALRLQNAARNSMEWFENVRRYVHLPPEQFAYSLLTRSQRVSHENLRLRDAAYLGGVERWFAARSGLEWDPAPPPLFTPFHLRGLALINRVVVAPMDMYSAVGGLPNDFHLVHLGARALGGAGLVMTEMTCVSPEGRISPGCTGMYADEHARAWQRIVSFVHEWSPAKVCFQVGHSGRKGSTQKMWQAMDEPLQHGNWPLIAPSPIPWQAGSQVPREMTRADMDRGREEFVRATVMAAEAHFDMIELHAAHGYLLSSFLTPVSNQRSDEYGGSLDNRLRYPLEVLRAMRAAWPNDRPISVRISATDWRPDGIGEEETIAIARSFHAAGADIIHVSAGQTSAEARPVYGRMFQTPFADRIRQEAGVPTIAVGNITDADQVNSIIAAGRADLVALARPHLADPNWTLHAASQLGFATQWWPDQYLQGKSQLERLLKRQAEMLGLSAI